MSNKRARVVTAFEEELTAIVKLVLNHLDSEGVAKIVLHLMSDKVGATCHSDLQYVEAHMLPPDIIPPIKANQLLRYFSNPGPSASGGSSQGSRQQAQEPVLTTSAGGSSSSSSRGPGSISGSSAGTSGGYEFQVPWSSLPKDVVDRLTSNEQNKVRSQQKDISTLKLAIVKKLVSSYTDYCDLHPGLQKTPGVEIYRSITAQVFQKFGFTLADVVNGKEVGDGKAGFECAVLVCTENQMRPDKNPKSIPNAMRGTGTVGVLQEEYLPNLQTEERELQVSIREELQTYYCDDPDSWLWDEIKHHMLNSYKLQREDVAAAKVAIEQQAADENNKENEQTEDEDDEPVTKALLTLKELWPFLFTVSGLAWHHNRLTGRDLQVHLNEFLDNHLEYILDFLTSCSKNNKKNVALSLKLKKKVLNWTAPLKFLQAIFMIGNHFGEEKFNFIHSTEKTSLAGELDTTGLADICIIAQDSEPFSASKYFICADEVMLMEVNCPLEAITGLVQLAFVLDLNYPKMPRTFEFLERFVYGMGLSNTRVTNKKGKVILVLTPAVRDLMNNFKEFQKEMQDEDN